MYMPFGKYKGRTLEALPDDYVIWLLTIELRNPLKDAIDAEQQRRARHKTEQEHARAKRERDANRPVLYDVAPERAEELVTAGLRTLAKRYHPDVGGNTQAMADTLEAAQWLRAVIRLSLSQE